MSKILVIDYDQKNLQSLSAFLYSNGYEVIIASNGLEGWEKYKEEKPALVLIEPMISKIHGFELCQKIVMDSNQNVPVFIITGIYKDSIYRTEALRSYGASEYFVKPVDHTILLNTIKKKLSNSPKDIRPARKEFTSAEPERTKPSAQEISVSKLTNVDHATSGEEDLVVSVKSVDELLGLSDNKKLTITSTESGKTDGTRKTDIKSSEIDELIRSALKEFDLTPGKKKEDIKPPARPKSDMVQSKEIATVIASPQKKEPEQQPAVSHREVKKYPHPDSESQVVEKKVQDTKPDRSHLYETQLDQKFSRIKTELLTSELDEKQPESKLDAVQEIKREKETISTSHTFFQNIYSDNDKKSSRSIIILGLSILVLSLAAFIIFQPQKSNKKNAGLSVETAVQTSSEDNHELAANLPDLETSEKSNPLPENKQGQPAKSGKGSDKTANSSRKPADEDAVPQPLMPEIQPPTSLLASSTISPEPVKNASETSKENNEQPKIQAKTDDKIEISEITEISSQAEENATLKQKTDIVPKKVTPGMLVNLIEAEQQPQVIKSFKPVYPELARKFKVEGSVTVNALIDEFGNVIDTTILRSLKEDYGINRAAEEAVRKWKFRPAFVQGIPVKVWRPVVIVFKLSD